MKCYPEYKESEFEWIRQIPAHWKTKPVWMMFHLGRGRVISNEEIGENSGQYPVYSSQTENDGIMGYIDTYDFDADYITWTTDGAKAGTVFYRRGKFNCTNVCGTLSPSSQDVNLRFFGHALNMVTSRFVRHDINPKLMNNVMAKIRVQVPPLAEQTQIANFLDHKTQQIDDLIRVKERKIELLHEYRASLIHQAVTKGLDPNVEMNPSGVEWIGNVPKHWEVKKIKYLARLISKGTTPTTIGREILDHGEIRFIKAENIVDNQVKLDPEYYIDEETNQMLKRSQLKENDILFVIAGTIGKVGLVSRNHLPANTNQAVSFIRPYEKELPEFIYYWLQSDNIQQIVWRDVVQTAQPNLSMEDLGNLYIPYPSIAEQERIVDYISNKTRSIVQLLQQVYRQIELLKEYRQSLISAVVTGKIDVRGEV